MARRNSPAALHQFPKFVSYIINNFTDHYITENAFNKMVGNDLDKVAEIFFATLSNSKSEGCNSVGFDYNFNYIFQNKKMSKGVQVKSTFPESQKNIHLRKLNQAIEAKVFLEGIATYNESSSKTGLEIFAEPYHQWVHKTSPDSYHGEYINCKTTSMSSVYLSSIDDAMKDHSIIEKLSLALQICKVCDCGIKEAYIVVNNFQDKANEIKEEYQLQPLQFKPDNCYLEKIILHWENKDFRDQIIKTLDKN